MKKVAIYGQIYSAQAKNELKILVDALEKNSIVIFFEKHFYDALISEQQLSKKYPTFNKFNDLNNSFDMFISFGGDGTMLRAVTYIRDLGIPILGINAGRLGFLASIQKESIAESIDLLMQGNYSIQERTLLSVTTSPNQFEGSEISFALNEITIARQNTTSMIGIKTFLNGEYLTNYWADGLIIATPTGSTGYSLSCNGPVISPSSKSIVITPIAPHNLNARPMVIPENTDIELEVSAREKNYLISLDSRIKSVPINTTISIKKSPFTIKTVIPSNQSFLKTLRSKLLWGEDTRNESNS